MMSQKIAVIGLGYVGLPPAMAFGRKFETAGFDKSERLVEKCRSGKDPHGDLAAGDFERADKLTFSDSPESLSGADFIIVAVPTPVDAAHRPDLSALVSASREAGRYLKAGAVVIYESTVYPGATEEVCIPELERASGMKWPRDFNVGYSPERINPGDREHALSEVVKIVSGDTPETLEQVARLYESIIDKGVYRASSIRVAEAAKVIENAQRDINIAFINEITQIFQKLGISAYDVLEAAKTKWNFLDFRPGLVGGHCIGVDPFYLAHCAQKVGHNPEIILAGRRINDGMGTYIAERIAKLLANPEPGRKDILVLGLTFKENVPDLRNSKVVDVVNGLRVYAHRITVHDPFADPREASAHYRIELAPHLPAEQRFDCLVGAVAHRDYCAFDAQAITGLLKPGGLVADVKGMWRKIALPDTIQRWEL